jgi:hypothetical protein
MRGLFFYACWSLLQQCPDMVPMAARMEHLLPTLLAAVRQNIGLEFPKS